MAEPQPNRPVRGSRTPQAGNTAKSLSSQRATERDAVARDAVARAIEDGRRVARQALAGNAFTSTKATS